MAQIDTMEILVENAGKSLDAFTTKVAELDILAQKNPAFNLTPTYNQEFNLNYGKMEGDMLKIIKQAQSITLSDTMTSWFGWFDHEIKALKVKKSELLAKRNVKNYTYKRHIWNYHYIDAIVHNIFSFIGSALNGAAFALNNSSFTKYSEKDLNNILGDHFRQLDNNIDRYLFGKKPNILKNRIIGSLLGDGFKPVIINKNFQDEHSISTLIDLVESFDNISWQQRKNYMIASLKDVQAQINDILKNFKAVAGSKSSKAKDFCNKWIKICTSVIGLLMKKYNEFIDADNFSLKTQCTEIYNVLKGLLEYTGD